MIYEPDTSPWGKIVEIHELCHGAFLVHTESHGGIMVNLRTVVKYLNKEAQSVGFPFLGYLCFEEECDAPVAIRELIDQEQYIPQKNEFYAEGEFEGVLDRNIQKWHPEYWKTRCQRLGILKK